MYKLNLTEAYCPAQADTPMRERTIEEMLPEQVETHGDGLALREMFAIVVCAGLLLIWRDPGRWPNGIQTFGDLTRRTAPLNVRTLKEAGGKPSDRWSILTAIASEHGHLEPDAISPATFLHKKSMDEALAA